MTRRVQSHLFSPLAVALLLGLLAASVVGPATVAADDMTISQAELHLVDLLNKDRTDRGLVPVRVDGRLMAIARARSVDMATKHYFSHVQPDGRNVFNILDANRITWYGAGEIIAYNNYTNLTLEQSAGFANSQWMNSPDHKAIVISTSMNYVGVGIAIDASTGRKIFTAVYIKGPDRTGARSTTQEPIVGASVVAGTRRVSVSWTGADVKLQVLTSGFNSWKVQRRTDGGAWTTVWASTTRASMTLDLADGHTYEFRTAARDNAGNWGAWSTVGTALGRVLGSGSRR
jgi:uncharacterized protein YkwD